MFPEVREAVAALLDPAKLRWITWSHFESDECSALNDWLATAPHAQPACSLVGGLVSVNDFCGRETRLLTPEVVLNTGKYRFRYYPTPQLPHGWDAGVLFAESQRTLFCSDLFHQAGDVEAITHSSILDRSRQSLTEIQAGPLANYVPYTPNTSLILQGLASLAPMTLAVQHGTSFSGNCSEALLGLEVMVKELLNRPTYSFPQVGGESTCKAAQ